MPGKRYAVLIGNGSFPGEHPESRPRLPPLRCPTSDVRGLQEILEAEAHGGYQITALIDRPHNEARRSIYDSLRKAGPEDQVIIYYSGHGKLDENGSLYLAGSDTDPESLDPTALAAADVQKYVGESRAASRIVILDCCFSGAIGQSFLRGAAKGEVADQAGQAVHRLGGQGVFYLTASTDTQTAEEKDNDRYSLLTKFIIDGISNGDADTDDDGEVRFSELCSFVQEKVRLEGTQRPLSFTLKGYGDPVVALTGRLAFTARRDAIEQQVYELCRLQMLHGADAAKLLGRLHQPVMERVGGTAAAQRLMDELYQARLDRPLFLKAVHNYLNMPEESGDRSSASRDAIAASTRSVQEEGTGAAAKTTSWTEQPAPGFSARDPLTERQKGSGNFALSKRTAWTALMSLAVVVSLIAVVWVLKPFGHSSDNAGMLASSPANTAASNPAPTNSGTSLVYPGGKSLIDRPSKLLAVPNTTK
jgi:hypothetical protein